MTKVISIESFVKAPPVILTVGGKKHPMVPATVETFLTNMKELEDLALDASPSKELEVTVRVIQRAFPTLTEKQIKQWSLEQIQGIADMARGASGEVVTTDETKAAEAKKSGKSRKANSAR